MSGGAERPLQVVRGAGVRYYIRHRTQGRGHGEMMPEQVPGLWFDRHKFNGKGPCVQAGGCKDDL